MKYVLSHGIAYDWVENKGNFGLFDTQVLADSFEATHRAALNTVF